jgi:hypothetical protein
MTFIVSGIHFNNLARNMFTFFLSHEPQISPPNTGFSLSHGTSFFAQLPSRQAPRSGTSASLAQPVATGSTSMA